MPFVPLKSRHWEMNVRVVRGLGSRLEVVDLTSSPCCQTTPPLEEQEYHQNGDEQSKDPTEGTRNNRCLVHFLGHCSGAKHQLSWGNNSRHRDRPSRDPSVLSIH